MIYKYLLEIKYRILFCFIAWSFMVINCYLFKETLLYLFIKLTLNYDNNNSFYFLTTNITEVFIAYINLSYFITNQIIILFICYQVFIFITPGLYKFEYVYLKTIFIVITSCWVIFICVLNNFIFPISWDFFLKFQQLLASQSSIFYFEAKLNEYLIFYKSIYSVGNLIYQIIILFFIFLDLFKTNLLIIKRFRKFFYFIFFLFATFITPPEVIYQLIVSICIILMYELMTIYFILKIELVNFKLATN